MHKAGKARVKRLGKLSLSWSTVTAMILLTGARSAEPVSDTSAATAARLLCGADNPLPPFRCAGVAAMNAYLVRELADPRYANATLGNHSSNATGVGTDPAAGTAANAAGGGGGGKGRPRWSRFFGHLCAMIINNNGRPPPP